MRLFLHNIFFLAQLLLRQILHLLLQGLVDQTFRQPGRTIQRVAIFLRVELVRAVDLVVVDLQHFFEALVQLLAHLWLQLLEALVELDLRLEVRLLPVSLRNLLVLLIARLEANVLEVVPESLYREHWRANLAVSFNARDRKHQTRSFV